MFRLFIPSHTLSALHITDSKSPDLLNITRSSRQFKYNCNARDNLRFIAKSKCDLFFESHNRYLAPSQIDVVLRNRKKSGKLLSNIFHVCASSLSEHLAVGNNCRILQWPRTKNIHISFKFLESDTSPIGRVDKLTEIIIVAYSGWLRVSLFSYLNEDTDLCVLFKNMAFISHFLAPLLNYMRHV